MILSLFCYRFKYFERISPLIRGKLFQQKVATTLLKNSQFKFSIPLCTFSSQISGAFKPEKALVLTKFSRYEFEKRRHPALDEDELKKNLAERGSDYSSLIHHHSTHTKNKESVIETLRSHGVETRLVDRFEYTDENVEWADVVFTTGGDGTFLMAASKILDREKPLIGINSDPSRSVGHLCLPAKYTFNFEKALKKLMNRKFKWTWRQRIRIHMQGINAFDPPIELHDQQLPYPEYRFLDCYNEEPYTDENSTKTKKTLTLQNHCLPVRALNEVFIGESLSSRTSYYEVSVDGSSFTKQRSSGITMATGTGSSSWHLNTNMMTTQDVLDILKITSKIVGKEINADGRSLNQIADTFNGSLIFDPSLEKMGYTIRDPQHFGTNEWCILPRGFANKVQVKSRCFDACLVIDGGLSFVFNDGATAELGIFPEDALKTAIMHNADANQQD